MLIHPVATCQLKIICNFIQEHSEDNQKLSSAETSGGCGMWGKGGGGGDSGFQVPGMIKGFFSVSGFVWVGKFEQVLIGQLDLSRDCFGY